MATAKEKKALEEQRAKAVSLNPEEMAEGGGLLDNIRATIKEATFVMTDYGGKSSMVRPAAHLVLEEPDGEIHDDQFWSCGKAEDWVPSDDGKYLIPTGLKTQIHKSSNLGMFLQSLMDCGFPADKFDADIGFLVGLEAHFQQVDTGREKKKSKDGTREYADTALCVAEIFNFPWEKKGGKSGGGKTAKKTAPKKAPKAQADDEGGRDGDLESEAMTVIMGIVAESGDDGIVKKALATAIMQAREGEDQKVTNKILKLAFSDAFLEGDGVPWTYEDGVLTM